MAFNSFTFLFLLLPLFLAAYFLLPQRPRSIFLIAASFSFYYWSEGRYALILAFLLLVLSRPHGSTGRPGGEKSGKAYFALALALLVLVFVHFKYSNFLAANFNSLLGLLSVTPVHFKPVHLPLGISFFMFSAISCLVDLRRRTAAEVRPALRVIALYLTLFPKLLTGPIIPFHEFIKLEKKWGVTAQRILFGIRRFILGLGKKVLVADVLAQDRQRHFRHARGTA